MNIVDNYTDLIGDIVATTGLSHIALHLIFGPIIYVHVCFAFPRASCIVPLQFTLTAELMNEIMNRLHYGSWRWPDTVTDIMLTMVGPCALAILTNGGRGFGLKR